MSRLLQRPSPVRPKIFSISELRAEVGLSERTIWEMVSSGNFPAQFASAIVASVGSQVKSTHGWPSALPSATRGWPTRSRKSCAPRADVRAKTLW